MLGQFRIQGEQIPDYIAVINYNSPFLEERHISEAIDTIFLYETDSVISVTTDLSFHWKPGEFGLTPTGYKERQLKLDKETVYKETGSIYVIKRENLERGGYLGNSIGNIEMSEEESWKIESEFDFWVAMQMKEKAVG